MARAFTWPDGLTSTNGAGAAPFNCGLRMQHLHRLTFLTDHGIFRLRVDARLPNEPLTARGPFVYRLGRQVFNLERGVRFPYGLPFLFLR